MGVVADTNKKPAYITLIYTDFHKQQGGYRSMKTKNAVLVVFFFLQRRKGIPHLTTFSKFIENNTMNF